MSENQCRATTKSGSQCKIKAINADGYCHLHDPKTKAYREERRQNLKPLPSMIVERRFSERRGYRPVAETLQVEAISIELRNSLWNAISQNALKHLNSKFADVSFFGGIHDNFIRDLWVYFFKKPIDLIPSKAKAITETILRWYATCEWYEVYDFVEYVLNYQGDRELITEVNWILERELSGYRFVDERLVEVTNDQEIEMLEEALIDDRFVGVKNHLRMALVHLSSRENPDYRNSIKESISAVESMAKCITGNTKTTLGEALSALERSGSIHPALKRAFTSLYGYTSDADGIRHAMLDEPSISAADAKYFLLSCTSFINYLKSKL